MRLEGDRAGIGIRLGGCGRRAIMGNLNEENGNQ